MNINRNSLTASELDILAQYDVKDIDLRYAVRLLYAPGEYLVREGRPIDYLYIVISGKAKVCLSISNGKKLLLSYFASNGIIGDLELMSDKREAFTTVQAVTKLTCIGIPLSLYTSVLRGDINFVNRIGKELANKLVRSGTNGAVTILQPLEARLCAYIRQTAVDGVFKEKHTEVAELVGTSYRHLMRCIDKLCREGVLLKKRAGYEIIDYEALSRRAGDLYSTVH